MTTSSPNDLADELEAQEFIRRIGAARATLHIHGFLTGLESQKVQRRIKKWMGKNSDFGPEVPSWPRSSLYERVETARLMLLIWNFTTDAEDRKVKKRVEKWKQK